LAKQTTCRPFDEAVEYITDASSAPETKGFIGERYGTGAGLQYLNARYYDPALGMFIQPDWFEVTLAGGRIGMRIVLMIRLIKTTPAEIRLLSQRKMTKLNSEELRK